MSKQISVTLKVWRQKNPNVEGNFEIYQVKDLDTDASFLEMLDVVNEDLTLSGADPIAFDHDCREGICGTCGLVVNGQPHGEEYNKLTVCQLHMREFKDGDLIVIEPFRAKAFPLIKDLSVDRSAFDRILEKGGYVSVRTGSAIDANTVPIEKDSADKSFNAAQCIGCGACVASCPNASAMLFTSAKNAQYSYLPQGNPERKRRVIGMVEQMDAEGFGNCSNEYRCEASCPKGISVEHIARMNREYLAAKVSS